MEKLEERLEILLAKAKAEKVDLSKLKSIQRRSKQLAPRLTFKWKTLLVCCVMALIFWKFDKISTSKCLISFPEELNKIFRKPQNCDFCRGITSARRVSNLTPNEFEQKYAYTGEVIIVTDAMQNWTAQNTFDFWFFKDLYNREDSKRKTLDCQFFRYKTKFRNLFEAFNMPRERVEYEKGTEPWYFGWSNCNEHIATILRKHYDRPYFLPRTSELNAIDWIFMGGRGLGAHMHVDNVRLPSWQAQLKGEKEWILAPPPECYFECHKFSMIVHPGEMSEFDIFMKILPYIKSYIFSTVVLNTNKWYHMTNVLSNEISIVIGAEYD